MMPTTVSVVKSVYSRVRKLSTEVLWNLFTDKFTHSHTSFQVTHSGTHYTARKSEWWVRVIRLSLVLLASPEKASVDLIIKKAVKIFERNKSVSA